MHGERRFIGIDGGGTKTACVIIDEHGRILAKALGESGNMQSNTLDHVGNVIKSLLNSVLKDSGTLLKHVTGINISLAGCDRPADQGILREVLQGFLPQDIPLQLNNDALAALAAGTWGEMGVILIAGTGSIAYTLSESGKMCRAGGWGYLLGDEGSGYAIGRAGLSAVLKAYDGSEQSTVMTDVALQAWSLESPADMVPFIYGEGESKQKIASFAKIVLASAKKGDAVSLKIVNEAIEDLHKLVHTAWRKAEMQSDAKLVIGGGLFSESFFKEKFLKRMGKTEVIHPAMPPVIGAAVLAMKDARLQVTDTVKMTLQQSWNEIEKGMAHVDHESGLLTEQANASRENLDTSSVADIINIMNQEDRTVAETVKLALPDITSAVEAIVRCMENGGRLFYIGAGTSGRLGILDASECPPTFGVGEELVQGLIAGGTTAIKSAIENAEDDEEAGRLEVIEKVTANDAVVGIAASGRTPYVIGGIKAANDIGAVTIGISCNSHAPLSAHSRHPIEVPVGPEVVAGSTRLKAGTAQKMVLNMISTTAMIKLGKVYGSLMVNVQATNQKLRERVVRIVMDATHAGEDEAIDATKKAYGDARMAILMIQFGVSYETAKAALEETDGHFRKALESLERRK